MISNGESWIALAIIVASVLTAWTMNYRAPKVRAFGTLLAAFGCFAVVAWFVTILGTGILEDPKPNQTPMDSAKPVLLWTQAAVALVAALMLMRAASLQLPSDATLDLPTGNEAERYGIDQTPVFLFGRFKVVGAAPTEVLLEAAQRAAAD